MPDSWLIRNANGKIYDSSNARLFGRVLTRMLLIAMPLDNKISSTTSFLAKYLTIHESYVTLWKNGKLITSGKSEGKNLTPDRFTNIIELLISTGAIDKPEEIEALVKLGGEKFSLSIGKKDWYSYFQRITNLMSKTPPELKYIDDNLPSYIFKRNEIIEWVDKKLDEKPSPRVMVFVGEDGMGLSSLASVIEYKLVNTESKFIGSLRADMNGNNPYPFYVSWYLSLSPAEITDAFWEFSETRDNLREGIINKLLGRRYLIIIDGPSEIDSINELMVGSEQCLTIVTTNDSNIAKNIDPDGINTNWLIGLNEIEIYSLIKNYSNGENKYFENEYYKKRLQYLSNLLDGNPKYISIAFGYIIEYDLWRSIYIEENDNEKGQLRGESYLVKMIINHLTDQQLISFNEIKNLPLLGYYEFEIFQALWGHNNDIKADVVNTDDTLKLFEKLHLIDKFIINGKTVWNIHRLVLKLSQICASNIGKSEQYDEKWIERAYKIDSIDEQISIFDKTYMWNNWLKSLNYTKYLAKHYREGDKYINEVFGGEKEAKLLSGMEYLLFKKIKHENDSIQKMGKKVWYYNLLAIAAIIALIPTTGAFLHISRILQFILFLIISVVYLYLVMRFVAGIFKIGLKINTLHRIVIERIVRINRINSLSS